MKEHKQGDGALAPAEQDRAPQGPASPIPEAGDGSWGKGAATALERLRRNDYRGHPEPDRDRPRFK
ncbi:hypothetical protein [Ramlibacter sp.]|uniref:hypothetical protein n=1 Tax=Ramlibacter sp. TaxID=1917967 RepID=UPI002D61DB52|nr:hypothetical protein [Ramlibacter sp.]HYD76291.1 hypothetical protein [Ramlibacter sp.]